MKPKSACLPAGRQSAKRTPQSVGGRPPNLCGGRKTKSAYEGLQENVRNLNTPKIEVWKNQYPDKEYAVNLDIPEFTCICPKTGLPDFADIKIEYSPDKYCVELKSFKMYTLFYRDIGIFHEHLINKFLEDFVRAARPRRVRISGVFNPRGGITTTVYAEWAGAEGKRAD